MGAHADARTPITPSITHTLAPPLLTPQAREVSAGKGSLHVLLRGGRARRHDHTPGGERGRCDGGGGGDGGDGDGGDGGDGDGDGDDGGDGDDDGDGGRVGGVGVKFTGVVVAAKGKDGKPKKPR